MTHKTKKRRDQARVTFGLLATQFPKAFTDPPRPLKVGIAMNIAAASNIPLCDVQDALDFYCGRREYLRAIQAGVSRVDLTGAAVDVVTVEQAAHAKEKIEAFNATAWARAWAERKARRKTVSSSRKLQPSTPSPKPSVATPRKSATPKRSSIRAWRSN
jgi:sRNA-binding protein